MKTARGFTLLELMVAIAIFAVMALLAYGGLDSVLNQRRELELRLERIAQLQKAYMRLRSDFQQVRNRPVRDSFGDIAPALFVTPSAPVLEFTRGGWRNPTFQPRATQERVAYRVADGKLLRSSWRVLDRVQGSEPVELTVLDGVDQIGWRFIDPGLEWQPTWPPLTQIGQSNTAPPSAVELTLRTRDWGELRLLFRTGLDPQPQTQGPPS
jgi:general secretion pathway protein J